MGKNHIDAMLKDMEKAKETPYYSLISGFDAVNEEDYSLPIDSFVEQIL
jgi:hypothetical protein